MKIRVRELNGVFMQGIHCPFWYEDVLYAVCRNTRFRHMRKAGYKYFIVHVLTGQIIKFVKGYGAKRAMMELKFAEKRDGKTSAQKLLEQYGTSGDGNINVDEWNRLEEETEK